MSRKRDTHVVTSDFVDESLVFGAWKFERVTSVNKMVNLGELNHT
jgi:hypothetical protein